MQHNNRKPFISICIPAYKRVHYLKRLLDSIRMQQFRDFEVILSDDSPDASVRDLVSEYEVHFPIHYFQNKPSLGTPANWNAAIAKANGEWIKLIHDDDWFARADALGKFAAAAKSGKKFIFSAYANHIEQDSPLIEKKQLPVGWKKKIIREPMTLLAYNVIGPPSVTLFHHSIVEVYDERLKWRVDMEFYVRVLHTEKAYQYIPESLVNVGVNDSQVTQSCLYQPPVELPEGKILLEKHGLTPLGNIWVYDAWWRLLRNMGILSPEQLQLYAPGIWPTIILKLQEDLAALPTGLLGFGPISKSFMFLSYLKNQTYLLKKPT